MGIGWIPPEMWEAHGVPWGAYTRTYEPPPNTPCERFCATCACSQKGVADTPCWNCGGKTQPTRPGFWPVCGSQQIVISGASFSPGEVEEEHASS